MVLLASAGGDSSVNCNLHAFDVFPAYGMYARPSKLSPTMANRRILIAVAALVAVRIYLHVLMEQDFAVRPYRPGLAYKRFDFNIHRWEDERVRRNFS
jgi:hypothetical protein